MFPHWGGPPPVWGGPCLGAESQVHRLAGQDHAREKTPNPTKSLEQKPVGRRAQQGHASVDANPARRA